MPRFLVFLLVLLLPLHLTAENTLLLETPDILAPFAPLVMERFNRAGIDAKVSFAPFVRLQQDLVSEALDGAFFLGESFLKASATYSAVPVPLYRNEYLAVTLAGGPVIRTARDLKNKTVAFPRGYPGMAEVAAGAEITTVIDEEQGFRMLGGGRVQVMIASRTSTLMFGALAEKPLTIHEPPLVTSVLYLVVRRSLTRENEALAAVFRESLRDGSWERDVAEVIRKQTVAVKSNKKAPSSVPKP